MATYLTHMAVAAYAQVLSGLGLEASEQWLQLLEWNRTQTVQLRFSAERLCAFNHTTISYEDSDTQNVTTISNLLNIVSKTRTKVTKHFWELHCHYSITAFAGNNTEEGRD